MSLGLLIAAMTAFVVFQPVTVVPRMNLGPEYDLVDQHGDMVGTVELSGKMVLWGFGYSNDLTGAIDETIGEMLDAQRALEVEGMDYSIQFALILYDEQRDTVEQRLLFANEQGLEERDWLVLGGEADTLKRIIGQGFGIYYEAIPLDELIANEPELAMVFDENTDVEGYGYLQAYRYVLIDENNIVRAEYRAPLDIEMVVRDAGLIIREAESKGASRALNEAAHLFLCYP